MRRSQPMLLLACLSLMAPSACSSPRHGGGGGGGGGDGDGGGEGEGEDGRPGDGRDAGPDDARDAGPGGPDVNEDWLIDAAPCESGERVCRGPHLYYCLNDQTWAFAQDCGEGDKICMEGECRGCVPEEARCLGNTVMLCLDDGLTEEIDRVCPGGSRCNDGRCTSACGGGDDKVSNAGCEYWAVDLDNVPDEPSPGAITPATAQFAVVVSNVNAEASNISIYQADARGREELVQETEVRAGDVAILNLAPRSQVGSGKSFVAYRIEADQPVIAYQFNPLNNTDQAFSNDASLLIPSHAFGSEYYVTTGDGILGGEQESDWSSYVTVVGVSEEPVEVTVEGAIAISVPEGEGIESEGNTVRTTLARYEVLSVHSLRGDRMGRTNTNMSGTRVTATGPVAVFGGSVATTMPYGAGVDTRCCADHLEEQMWPVSAWGKTHIAPRSLVRRPHDPEPDYWRITGSVDGTELTYAPSRPILAPTTLQAGESAEFKTTTDFAVTASEPVLVTQYLTSSGTVYESRSPRRFECGGEGEDGNLHCFNQTGFLSSCTVQEEGSAPVCMSISDPAMILVPPIEQFRTDYVFLTPLDYQIDFVNLIAPAGAEVNLNGRLVTEWERVAEIERRTWQVATVELGDGRHKVQSDQPVGVLVYGYDRDVSYGYPAGLNLEVINGERPRR